MVRSRTERVAHRRRLGLTVRSLRWAADLTLKELGLRISTSVNRLSLLERGVAVFKPAELQALMAVAPGLDELLRKKKPVLGVPADPHAPADLREPGE